MKNPTIPLQFWNDKFFWNPITGLREYDYKTKKKTKIERVIIPLV